MKLTEKSGIRILVITPISAVRQITTEALRNIGFSSLTFVSTGKDAIAYLACEEVDWIVSSVRIDEHLNGLALLQLILKEYSLRKIKCSLICEAEVDGNYLPLAFELGALSYHEQTFILDEAIDSLTGLMSFLNANECNYTLTAAEYIRTIALAREHKKSLFALESNLLSMFPGNRRLLLCLAEAQFVAGRQSDAFTTIEQIKLLAPKMIEHCNRLITKYQGNVPSEAQAGKNNAIGIKTAIVVDPDEHVLKTVESLLKAVGVNTVEKFESAEKAYAWLVTSKIKPEAVIMEWRQVGLTGHAFIQRLRVDLEIICPIVVVSSLVRKEDYGLIKEMGVSALVEKPFETQDFLAGVISAIQKSKSPSDGAGYLTKVKRLLKERNFQQAEQLMAQYCGSEDCDQGTRLEMVAEYCFSKGNFAAAKDFALKAIKNRGDTLQLMNLVGKILLARKEYKMALGFFEKAQEFSPKNIERLYNISDASLMADDPKTAKEALKKIRDIDATHSKLGEHELKVALETGDAKRSKEKFAALDTSENIISYMNARAISLVKNSRFDDAISLYDKTCESMPPKWEGLKSAVHYNKALAFARAGKIEAAHQTLNEIKTFFGEDFEKKVKSLIRKIDGHMSSGEDLGLSPVMSLQLANYISSPEEARFVESMLNKNSQIFLNFEPARGDVCCYLVYRCVEGIDQKAKDLLDVVIRFQKRSM